MRSNAKAGLDLDSVGPALRSKWGWFVALGVALLVLACIAFANLVAATLVWSSRSAG